MSLWGGFLDLLYPRVCAACGASGDEAALCARCAEALEWNRGPGCGRCGADVEDGATCTACIGRAYYFDRAVALGSYRGQLRELVLKLKFHGERALAEDFGRRLAGRVRAAGLEADAVAFVPMGKWKLVWERHYNSAEILAERVARDLGKPLLRCLRKTRRTEAQAALALEKRLTNLADAFASRKVSGKRILLVDDVLTTGATASECARALSIAGAVRTSLAVVARSHA